jgi:hypothetical protein
MMFPSRILGSWWLGCRVGSAAQRLHFWLLLEKLGSHVPMECSKVPKFAEKCKTFIAESWSRPPIEVVCYWFRWPIDKTGRDRDFPALNLRKAAIFCPNLTLGLKRMPPRSKIRKQPYSQFLIEMTVWRCRSSLVEGGRHNSWWEKSWIRFFGFPILLRLKVRNLGPYRSEIFFSQLTSQWTNHDLKE